jgi:hypothetical protein
MVNTHAESLATRSQNVGQGATSSYTIHHGLCIDVMRTFEADSIDALVSDPPYGLKFQGAVFDNLGEGSQQREWHRQWAVEALRVLKPGAYALAFGGARTYHHLALMESRLSSEQHRMPAAGAGIVSVGGAAGPDWCATRGQTLIRGCMGWLPCPQDRFSS